MHWLPKIYKTLVGVRFIATSYYCSTNPLSDTITKTFKMIFNTVESFHKKGFFYSGCKKFWVVEKSVPVVIMLNKIKIKSFDCSTLYTTGLHKLLLKVPSEVINFAFKSKVRKCIGFSKTSIYWTSNSAGRRYFTKQTHVDAISFLINKCFITLLVTWFLNKILVYQNHASLLDLDIKIEDYFRI